jgi:hypothetical protein
MMNWSYGMISHVEKLREITSKFPPAGMGAPEMDVYASLLPAILELANRIERLENESS